MKKIYRILILFLYGVLFYSCENENYFAGEITTTNDFKKEYKLIGEEVKLEGIYTGYMSVYDSLILFCSSQYPDYKIYTYSLNNGKQLKSLFKVGRGPNEFRNLTHTEQYVRNNNSIKLWFYDEQKSHMLVDITRSIKLHTDSLVIDSIIPIDIKKATTSYLSFIFTLDNHMFVTKTPCERAYYKDVKYSLGEYILYRNSLDTPLQSFTLFTKPLINRIQKMNPNIFYESYDRIKPDKSKIAMAMWHMAQINILDLKTGKLKGFRIKGTPDFNYLEGDPEHFRTYYQRLSVDNQYIYALYEDRLSYSNQEAKRTNTIIHVYDWDGNPVCKLVLAEVLGQMSLDPVTGYLYGKTYLEEVFRYNLKSILSKM